MGNAPILVLFYKTLFQFATECFYFLEVSLIFHRPDEEIHCIKLLFKVLNPIILVCFLVCFMFENTISVVFLTMSLLMQSVIWCFFVINHSSVKSRITTLVIVNFLDKILRSL